MFIAVPAIGDKVDNPYVKMQETIDGLPQKPTEELVIFQKHAERQAKRWLKYSCRTKHPYDDTMAFCWDMINDALIAELAKRHSNETHTETS